MATTRLGDRLPTWTLAALGVALWLALLAPYQIGGSTGYVIVAGASMEPALQSGDLILVKPTEQYHQGDIVAFATPQGLVIHRIIGGSAQAGFRTQGDNRSGPDLWRPTPDQIVGRSWIRIPGAGAVLMLVRSPLVLAGLAGVSTFLAVWSDHDEKKRSA